MVRRRLTAGTQEEFWSNVNQDAADGCWTWQGRLIGSRRPGGQYGGYCYGGRQWYTHRLAYYLSLGPIPDGLKVRHTCDNPPCCNPAHLLLGTQADNMRDKKERGRAARGERSHAAKVTEQIVADIRRRRAAGEPRLQVAAEYGISYTAVFSIERGRSWGHVADPPPGVFPNPPGQENRPTTYRKGKAAA